MTGENSQCYNKVNKASFCPKNRWKTRDRRYEEYAIYAYNYALQKYG